MNPEARFWLEGLLICAVLFGLPALILFRIFKRISK